MTRSGQTLLRLRDLQRLREKRQEVALLAARTAQSDAERDHRSKSMQLEEAGETFAASTGRQTLQIGQWLLLAHQVSQLERETNRTRETLRCAEGDLVRARGAWELAHRQSHELADRAAEQCRRDRRKDDDRRERTNLSLYCERGGRKS